MELYSPYQPQESDIEYWNSLWKIESKWSLTIPLGSSQSIHLNMSLWFLSVTVARKRSSLFSHFLDNEQDITNEGRFITAFPENSRFHPVHSWAWCSFFPLTATPDCPLCMATCPNRNWDYSNLIRVQPPEFSYWTDVVLDQKDNDHLMEYTLLKNHLQRPTQAKVGTERVSAL